MTIRKQNGSFMLEFLISLAIFSIAIIGLVKLQNRSISDLSDLGTDMAIPILIADFTDRINLSSNEELDVLDQREMFATAAALSKTLAFDKNTIKITDVNTETTKEYTVVLDNSRIINKPGDA